MLIYILIVIFLVLISYQTYLVIFPKKLLEGLENTTTTTTQEYKPYNLNDPNNSLILAQQNAGNIEVLKKQMDELQGLKKDVIDYKDLTDKVDYTTTTNDEFLALVEQKHVDALKGMKSKCSAEGITIG